MRLLCLGAWLTWMCLMIRLLVSRPLVSALASAFLRRPMRISADLTGQRARETPRALPVGCQSLSVGAIDAVQFTLRSASGSASVPPHGDGLLVLEDISEVGEGALELPAVDGLGSLAGVLEGDLRYSSSAVCHGQKIRIIVYAHEGRSHASARSWPTRCQ